MVMKPLLYREVEASQSSLSKEAREAQKLKEKRKFESGNTRIPLGVCVPAEKKIQKP